MKTGWILGLSAPLWIACASDSGGNDTSNSTDETTIATTPLGGLVDGKAWAFVSGETSAFLSEGEPTYFTNLYAEQFGTCSGFADPVLANLILNIPRTTGTHPLSVGLNATFSIPRGANDYDNLVATKGRLEIVAITATTIRGGAFIDYNANNRVNGQFEAAICPD